MKVLITGTSHGIGLETAYKFLHSDNSFNVVGIDVDKPAIKDGCHGPKWNLYTHIQMDLREKELPDIPGINILINNAGVQNSADDVEINLKALMAVTEKYGIQPYIKAIVNVASTSAHNGAEFPAYAASKGGVLAYTKNVAQRVAGFGATCNSISPGGVATEMNRHIMSSPELWEKVLDETLLHKWATAEEIAKWIYFIAVENSSMTGQDIIIDNGELCKFNFIW